MQSFRDETGEGCDFGASAGRCLWLLLVLGCVGAAAAQDEGMGGGAAFAGGQMVRGTVTAVARGEADGKDGAGGCVPGGDDDEYAGDDGAAAGEGAEAIAVGSGVGAMGLLDAPTKTVHAMVVMVIEPGGGEEGAGGDGEDLYRGEGDEDRGDDADDCADGWGRAEDRGG